MEKEKMNKILPMTLLFVIILSSLSLAQETSNQLSDKTSTLEITENQLSGEPNPQISETPTIELNEEPISKIIDNIDNASGSGNNESTYYLNTRPADFIQVVNTNGTIINETYIYLQDKLIAKYDTNGRKFFYHPDHLGSTSLVTNESGDVVEDLLYLPYGDILSGNELSRFLYTNHELDRETDFYDTGARSYNSRFRRFIQPDQVIKDVYNPQNLNRYTYVLNNPYKYVDPNGLWEVAVGPQGNLGVGILPGFGAGVQLGAGVAFSRSNDEVNQVGKFQTVGVGSYIGAFGGVGLVSIDPFSQSLDSGLDITAETSAGIGEFIGLEMNLASNGVTIGDSLSKGDNSFVSGNIGAGGGVGSGLFAKYTNINKIYDSSSSESAFDQFSNFAFEELINSYNQYNLFSQLAQPEDKGNGNLFKTPSGATPGSSSGSSSSHSPSSSSSSGSNNQGNNHWWCFGGRFC